MDFSKLWQLRIMYAMRSSTDKDPFYLCKNIGLDFNAASERKQKLDLQLLTNGLVYEVYDFANLVNKSKRQFIIDVLENNFDFGLESEQQRNDFCTRTLAKVKQLIKRPWIDKHELFSLPDTSSTAGHNHSSLTQVSNQKSSDIYNADWSLATAEHNDAESIPTELDRFCATEAEQGDEGISPRVASTEESKEDVFPQSYPFCKEIGLNLGYGSKQTLDMGLLTNGVMLEIEHFSRILCGFSREIILNVLEHNFELDFTSLDARDEAFRNLNCLLAKKAQIKKSNGAKTSLLEMKFFSSHVNPFKRKREETLLSNTENIEGPAPKCNLKEVIKRRQSDIKSKPTENMALNGTDVPTIQTAQWDQGLGDVHSYMCLEDSDLESDDAADSENSCYQESMQNVSGSPSMNIPRESEMRSQDVQEETFFTPTDSSTARLSLSPDLSQALATCSDGGQSVGQDQTQTTTNVKDLDDSDTMEQKETRAEQLMWKLRTHRVNEILLRSENDFCRYPTCRRLGLDFNVGSGVKQKRNAQSLTNCVLHKVAKFAVALNSSQQEFIMDILEYNFDLRFISGQQRHAFACETMHRVRQLTQCEDEVRLSAEVFELPGNKLKLTTNPAYHYSCGMSVNPEISSVSTMEVNDVAPVPPTNCNALVPEQQVDLYPHCMEIGLKLHVKKHQTHKKLDFHVLTKGAMTEVTNFAKMLCGTFEQIIIDVLDHNYDLDLQNGESDTARYILEQIPRIVEQKNRARCSKTFKQPHAAPVRPDEHSEPKSDSGSTVPSQTKITDHLDSCTEAQQELNEQDKTLWMLRTRRSQEILSVPHLEDCPLYSFSKCKKIGIDFNVGCGLKQNLDPKLLTNGVMVEIVNFATAVQKSQRHFIREILEYNFDLGLKSDLERHTFAHQTMAKLQSNSRPEAKYYGKKIFKLPDLSCIDLSDYLKAVYCPKCDQDRNLKLHGKEESQSDVTHHPSPHAKMDTAQRRMWSLSSTLPRTEGTGMNPYPHCKKIGVNLCVDEDQPREKFGLHLLTHGVMREVASFALKLSGFRWQIVSDILEHNFNLCIHIRESNPYYFFTNFNKRHQGLAWLSEVFSFNTSKRKPSEKWKNVCFMQKCHDWKKTAEDRQLALQLKKENSSLRKAEMSIIAAKKRQDSEGNCFPLCKKIGLVLDVESKSAAKAKLDLKLLTRAVVFEIHKYVATRVGDYIPSVLYDILNYNFDLSSQNHRRWEFSLAITQKVTTMVKSYQRNLDKAEEVFELPFVFSSSDSEDSIRDESETNGTDVPTIQTAQWDQGLGDVHSYMCPLEDSDLESDDAADSENSCYQESMQNVSGSPSLNIPRESEMRSQDVQEETFLSPTDSSSARLSLSADLSQALATCSDGGQSVGQGPTQTTTNVKDLDDSDTMEQKETGAEQLMWKLRTHRVNEILRSEKDYCRFTVCKRLGLDFNVGSGVKQKLNAQSLTNSVLLEVCKFAVAMNSSQQEFIMEILEYNFDLRFISGQHRHAFACETMHRVRQLTQCEDEVRCSKEAFELPVDKFNKLTTNPAYHYSCGMIVNPEISSVSTMEVNDVAPVPPTNCNALVPEQQVDLYPHCMEIGLKLHVKKHQTHKKLDFHVLTKAAIIEVTNFAKMLCGTFEQIIIDVLDHNYDLDLQNGESDTARYILEQIPRIVEQKNLASCSTTYKPPHAFYPATIRPDEDSELTSDSGSTVPSQTKITDHLDSCTETQQELNEQEKTLWTLRTRRSQEILSVPHLEDCPFYSFSRCKKIGIDFNVGCGLKQSLDRDLLTNGVMVEIAKFAGEILASHQYFITEILEYNFDLGLMSALERRAFAHQTVIKFKTTGRRTKLSRKRSKVFELPDFSIIDLSDYVFCPKCDQNRNHPNPHAKMDTVLSDAHDTAKKPAGNLSSTLPTTFGEGMNSFRHCKRIGLSLCVDEDQPREKLGLHLLTYEVMKEVVSFARHICGTRVEIVNSILEHNFSLGMYSRELNPSCQFFASLKHSHSWVAWCNKVFSFQPSKRKSNDPDKLKSASLTPKCQEFKKMAMKRKLALQKKKESSSLTNEEMCPKGTNKRVVRVGVSTPLCNKIGLELDVRSKSAAKAKLDLKLLTRAVACEIYKYAAKRVGEYMPSVLYEIFDYNFDLSSQNHRRWEFSLAIASNIKTIVRGYQKNQGAAEKVFELPFVFCHQASGKSASKTKKNEKLSLEKPDSDTQSSADLTSLIYADPIKTEAEEAPLDGSFNREIKEEKYDPFYTFDGTEFNNEDQKHLVPDATPGLNGYDVKTMFQETERKLTSDDRGESDWHYGDVSQPDMKVEIKQEEDP